MQLTQIAERAKSQLAAATSLAPLLVSGADKDADGWRLTVDMLELERIPESHSVVGTYEVRLDRKGDLVTWHRTGLRRRNETEWTPDEEAVSYSRMSTAEEIAIAPPSPRMPMAEQVRGA